MIFLLDTNAWIGHLRGTVPQITQKLRSLQSSEVVLCSVVYSELYYGALRSGPVRSITNLALIKRLEQTYQSLPFDQQSGQECAQIRDLLATRGEPIGPSDTMIAAIAKVHTCTLVTHNIDEFQRVPGLLIEDWQAPLSNP